METDIQTEIEKRTGIILGKENRIGRMERERETHTHTQIERHTDITGDKKNRYRKKEKRKTKLIFRKRY